MREELSDYAIRFSDYEGGATIGSLVVDRAERRQVEMIDLYAFVPAYDFGQSEDQFQGIRIENDFKAWYDVMRRLNHMFNQDIDLADLERQSGELVSTLNSKIEELERKLPGLNVKEYMQELDRAFTERSFMPLDEVWERELGDLFSDLGE
jgi:hypothetical protein